MTDHCETCFGPIMGRSRPELMLSWFAYRTFMAMPDWLAFGRAGFAILPWAGSHAFVCRCPDKNRAVRSALKG